MSFNYRSYDTRNLFRLYVFLVVFFFAVILFRFYQLQIRGHSRFEEMSTSNFEKIKPLIPPRGDIYDRNGTLLVSEKPAFSLYVIPAEFNDSTLHKLMEVLPLDSAKTMRKVGKWKHYKPVKIYRQLPEDAFSYIMENYLAFSGIEIRVEPRRRYFNDVGMSHLLGTLGEVTEKDAERFRLEEGDIEGKKGIEKYYDSQLRGEKGYTFVKVDVLGRVIQYQEPEKVVPPKPGYDLYLTIDAELQTYAEEMFQGLRGAMVVIDVVKGEILTIVSSPAYDLNLFTGPISHTEWSKLINDPTHPLYDRPIQSTYPPGSTFKIVSAIAALQDNIIDPEWSVVCPGYFKLGRRTIKCWKSDGHGKMNLQSAIQHSCNVYFYQLGLKIGLETWNKYSTLFRFGQRTGVDIYGEKKGLVPSFSWYNKKYGKNGWTKGHLANLAIGQGELLVSPLQMAQFAMMVANEGVYYTPHVRKYFKDKLSGRIIDYPVRAYKIPGVDGNTFKFVKNAMRLVVTDGTAGVLNIPDFSVAGKTGTAQNPHGDDHAWFIGFAPYENPRLAFAVIVENGGHGGSAAAPIVKNYLKKYFRKYKTVKK